MKLNKKSVSSLHSVLHKVESGFVRLPVVIDEVRIAESKKGKMRHAVLIGRPGHGQNSKLVQCYIAAAIMFFKHYKVGDSPIVSTPHDPPCYKFHTAITNHVREICVSHMHTYLEFIHVQAEQLFRVKKNDQWFSWYHADRERIR